MVGFNEGQSMIKHNNRQVELRHCDFEKLLTVSSMLLTIVMQMKIIEQVLEQQGPNARWLW